MNKKKIILPIQALLFLIISSSPTYAAKLILKSGKVIEGEIVEKTAQYTKINVAGFPVTYFSDEIDRLEEKPAESPQNPSASPKEEATNTEVKTPTPLPREPVAPAEKNDSGQLEKNKEYTDIANILKDFCEHNTLDADTASWDKYLSKDFKTVLPDGTTMDYKAFLSSYAAGINNLKAVEFSDFKMGKTDLGEDGKAYAEVQFKRKGQKSSTGEAVEKTVTWELQLKKEDGGWKIINMHGIKYREP